jgi:hypothetical protein
MTMILAKITESPEVQSDSLLRLSLTGVHIVTVLNARK